MSRLTLRLPTSLHRQLEHLAKTEGVSLNQLIVYLLSSHVSASAALHYHAEGEVDVQRARFEALRESLGEATPEAIDAVLDRRRSVEPEDELTPEIRERLEKRIEAARKAG